LENTAPKVRFEIVQLASESAGAAMRAGEIDLALGYVPGLEEGCIGDTLFSDEHVCLVRAGHPLKGKTASKQDLAGLRYVYASTNATGHRMIEQWLAELGMERDIVLRLPHFIVAPEIVRTTDLAVIFPRSIAERFNRGRAFRLLALPFDLPAIEVKIHTHVRFSSDAGIQWLRDVLMDMFAVQP
jgi:DNA-binding transcriptional LysR family regulator